MRIRELRKAAGMSQGELGRALGMSASAVGMYEQGRREPDTNTLLKLANLFRVSVDYLIGAADSPGRFDADEIAANVAQNLMDQPALMFNAECYTAEELSDLQAVIEASVRRALQESADDVGGME